MLSSEASAEPGQWDTSRAPYQKDIMDAFNDPTVEDVVFMSSAQVGKALDVETPIPTPTGWKKMGELSVGDTVFDENGQPCNVTFVTPIMHGRACYRLRFSDGAEIIADADHQWTVHNDIGTKSQFRVETKTTADLIKDYKQGRRNRYAIPTTKPIACGRARLPIDPYMLGVWLGDGHSYSTGITVSSSDRAEMERLINACGYSCKAQPDGNNWTLRVDPFRRDDDELCFGLSKDLRSLGLIEKGRSAKHIPKPYLRASVNQRFALLQGLMDTDGTIGKNGRCEFVTTSANLAKGFRELIASLGFKAIIATKTPTTTYKGEKVYGALAYRFSFIAYADAPAFRLKRKLARQPSREGRRTTETERRRITSIVQVASVPVRCIQVDSPSHLYLAGPDFVPTHNTEVLNNIVGYYIDFDPCPILVVQPNEKPMGEAWSKDRLAPMIRDTPSLRAKVSQVKSRDSGNTIFHKVFPGGQLSIAGANAPAGLASRPKRVILFDEVDRYPASAGTEGDPIELGKKRSTTFWNRKHGLFSTPTIKGRSRIEKAFLESDQRYRMCPCPCGCGAEFRLTWSMVVWGKDSPAAGNPEKAVYQCPTCSGYFDDLQKEIAVQNGQWVATAPFKGVAGFHLSELYSPWRTLKQIVRSFLEAKGDPSRMQVWVNTCLGETFEEVGESVDENELLERVEDYNAEVPARGLYITGGADVQPDRIEIEFVAWGAGEESWSIGYHVIHGDVDIPEGSPGSPWSHFTDLIRKRFRHESGVGMIAEAICIDTGGTGENTQSIYNYCKRHKGDRVFAVKGRGGAGLPIVGAPNRKRSGKTARKVDLYIVGTNNAKAVVMKRFKIAEPGAGYCHFPRGREDDYYRQLTAEKAVTKYVKGFPVIDWKKDNGRRNEALDCRVYAFAALLIKPPMFDKLAYRMKMMAERRRTATPAPEPAKEPEPVTTALAESPPINDAPAKVRRPRRRVSFVKNW